MKTELGKRLVVVLALLIVLLPMLGLGWMATTESGLRWAFRQAQPYFPGSINMAPLTGRLIGPIKISGLEYQHEGLIISADQADLDWVPAALLGATVDISRFHVQALRITLAEVPASAQAPALPEISIPWRIVAADVVITDLNIDRSDQDFHLKQVKLRGSTLLSRMDIDELSLEGETFQFNVKGQLNTSKDFRHQLQTDWRMQLPSAAIVTGEGRLTGNIKSTVLEQNVSGPVQLSLNAELNNLLKQADWRASIDIQQFDAAQLVEGWPDISGRLSAKGSGNLDSAALRGTLSGDSSETGPFDSNFDLHWLNVNDTLQVNQLSVHASASNTELNAKGYWQPGADAGELSLALDWQNLRWPIKDTPWLASATGHGRLEGTLANYHLEFTTDRPWPQAPPSSWYASAEGNREGMNIHSLHISALGGEARAKGRLSWTPQLVWQAELDTVGINPGVLWPQWPGHLNAHVTCKGRMENGQLIAAADIESLDGTLRGYPVTLHSQLDWQNTALNIQSFDLQSGTSRVSASGSVADTLIVNWAVTSADLGELYPDARGQVQARGRLSGTKEAPVIEATVQGVAMGLPGYEIGAVEGSFNIDLFRWQAININLAAQALDLQGYKLHALKLQADNQLLKLTASSELTSAQIIAHSQTTSQGWDGTIDAADIRSAQYGDWHLAQPVPVSISNKSLTIDTLCWNSQDAGLCAGIQQTEGGWLSTLKADHFPLGLANPWLPTDMKLEGIANANASFQFQVPDHLSGRASIELLPGVVNYPLLEGERERWTYQGGRADINLDDQGLSASAELNISGSDRFYGQLKLPGAQLLHLDRQQQSVQANAQLTIHELSIIEAIVTDIQDLRGELQLDLAANGTLAKPRFSGQVNLDKGSLRIPRLGLTIDRLSLKSQSDDFETLNYHLDAHSGDGDLTIQGQTRLEMAAGWPTEFIIKGDNFEIARIPEARLTVNPDLKVEVQDSKIDIQGNLHIPYAKLQPKDITTAAGVSEDAVIIGGEQAVVEKWAIHTKVRLTLGERVNFFGYGFEGRLGGNLLLEDEPGQQARVSGEISVPEGRYRAYGQRLDIEHGRLLYTGGPPTNPGIDLRAVRKTGNVTAGLKVKGTLNNPQMELFTIPAMGQTNALSYLLLGRPMESASDEEGAMMAKATLALGLSGGDHLMRKLGDRFGLDEMRVGSSDTGDQASLVMGRYLSPRTYISYGVGLLEAVNTFSVRHQISDKWLLKGESGEHQGADLLYTFEH